MRRISYSDHMQRRRIFLARLRTFAVLFLLYELVTGFFVSMYSVSSSSMSPTIEPGDVVIVSTLVYGPRNEILNFRFPGLEKPKRGDLVLMDAPFRERDSWIVSLADSLVRFVTLQRLHLLGDKKPLASRTIKRVIGIPGDIVVQKDGIYYVQSEENGHFLTEFELSGYIYDIDMGVQPLDWPKEFPLSGFYGPLTLGSDEYFVAGDDRATATDSRLFGPVTGKNIIGKVLVRYWPFKRFGIPQ